MRATLAEIAWSALGCFLSLGVVAYLSGHYKLPLLVPSFGSSAIMIYALSSIPMAQPKSVIGGQVVCAISGVLSFKILGNSWFSIALGLSLAVILMLVTKTLHPPGGGTVLIAVLTGQGYSFILAPIALGSMVLVLIALVVNNIAPNRSYPQYWF